jgi:hypothetical protein
MGYIFKRLNRFLVKNQFPIQGIHVLTNDIGRVVVPDKFEIPMIGRQPSVDDFSDLDDQRIETDILRLFISSMARVAFYGNFHKHMISRKTPKGIPAPAHDVQDTFSFCGSRFNFIVLIQIGEGGV